MTGNEAFRKLENLEKPVIAAVNGFALGGGCELSLACDIRIASTKAKFGQPEAGLGITPGCGGTQRLARTIGPGMAKELIYTAKIIDANEAYRVGLVNKVVEPENLMKEAKDLANTIAANAPIAVKMCKAAINKGIQCDIDTGLSYETAVFGLCFATEDQKEGMTAFVEKRDKCFKNR
jgi:enoyl-CoA hydratase